RSPALPRNGKLGVWAVERSKVTFHLVPKQEASPRNIHKKCPKAYCSHSALCVSTWRHSMLLMCVRLQEHMCIGIVCVCVCVCVCVSVSIQLKVCMCISKNLSVRRVYLYICVCVPSGAW